jgi:hypothetical protein
MANNVVGLIVGHTRVFELFSHHLCLGEAISGSSRRSVCNLLESLPPPYKSISWQILLLIVGMMPFALALQKTGGISGRGPAPPLWQFRGPHPSSRFVRPDRIDRSFPLEHGDGRADGTDCFKVSRTI